jgi:uncharacterized protein (PEP-CTERM system associated)
MPTHWRVRRIRFVLVLGAVFFPVLHGFQAYAQTEFPVAPGPAVPLGPAVGGSLIGPAGQGGFRDPGAPGAILSPESRARLGGVGFPFDSVAAAGAAGGRGVREPGLSLSPTLGIEQDYNDNIFFTARNKRDDLITRVLPGLLLNIDTYRLQGTLNYAPSVEFYWQNSDQNRTSHQGNGQFLGTIVPDLFFLDVRGQAATQSLSGGFTPGTEASVARQNQVQTLSFSVSPYVVQRFGGLATARVGYVYSYVNQDRVDPNSALPADQLASSFTPSEYSSHQAYGVLRTGEDFGRYTGQFTASGTTFVGSGLYEDAYKNIVVLENRYSITRTIAGLVEIGYETQHFNTVPVTDVEDVVWSFGTRLTPTPESTIVAKYGRRDGFNSFFLDGTLELGVRTRLFANYSERLTTSALNAGDLLGSVTLDPLGNPVDANTGAPVIPSIANSFLGVQSGLFREKVATATISQTWLRDTFSLSATQTDRTPVADAPGTTQRGFAQKGTSFTFSWGHDLAETTRLTSYVQYGITSSGASSGDSDSYGAGVFLSHQINPALVGTLSYRLNIRDGGSTTTGSGTVQSQNDDRAVQNVITAGIRQSF